MRLLFIFVFTFLSSLAMFGQNISPFWEELTSSDFALAVKESEGVCLVPLGVIEKHGQQLPLGTDVYTVRELCKRAASQEYCIIYPFYFVGQIFEAKHQPGTIAYSADLMFKMLDETCKEISRNGMKKIILVNGHGGNGPWLQYYSQIQLESPRDYALYYASTPASQEIQKRINDLRKTTTGGHADEVETSTMMVVRPDLVKLERAIAESGEELTRLHNLTRDLYLGIRWYARYPNHYAGDAKDANTEIGELALGGRAERLIELIKEVKADNNTIKLQNEFFKGSLSPLDTKATR